MAEKKVTRYDGFSGMVELTEDEALAWDIGGELAESNVSGAFDLLAAEVAKLRARVAELEAKS